MTETRRCGARTRSNGTCGQAALFGQARCRMHGGSSPQAIHAAQLRMAESQARAVLAELEIEPCDDPLEALSLLAGEVLAWRDVLRDQVRRLSDLAGMDGFGVERARAVVELYERAMDRCGKVLTAIAKLNLDERMVKLSEAQGSLIAQVIEGTLRDLNLDESQQASGRQIASKRLRLVGKDA